MGRIAQDVKLPRHGNVGGSFTPDIEKRIKQERGIPSQVVDDHADVMITEITEAPWYVQNDLRLAAPLISVPFTHGETGALMRKGQDDLLAQVNAVLSQMKADGSLRRLHEKYGLVYAYE